MTQVEVQPPVQPYRWPLVKNTNLFKANTFYCPFCGKFVNGRSKFLSELFKNDENANYIAQLIAEYKRKHFGFNYIKRIKEFPERSNVYNRKALYEILNNKECVEFLKKNKILPRDVKKLQDLSEPLEKLAEKRLGVKLVWR